MRAFEDSLHLQAGQRGYLFRRGRSSFPPPTPATFRTSSLKRVCTNNMRKLFLFGWVVILGGSLSGICRRGRQKGASLICSENISEQIGRNRSKSEQIKTNRGIHENKDRESEQIGRKRGDWNKPEQIGATPFKITVTVFPGKKRRQ